MALFTAENARVMAQKSVEARRAAFMRQAQREAETARCTVRTVNGADVFQVERLARVRGILNELDSRAAKERDPAELAKLAQAANYWHQQEMDLGGRPKPGAFKPGKVPVKKSFHIAQPLED